VWIFRLDEKGVALVGQVPNQPPMPRSPQWSLGMMTDLADSALAIAILGCIETLSIAKGIGAASGQRVDANQGFIGVGLANIAAAFFQCMPGSGSFVRSALNHDVGGQTRFAAIIGGLWVMGILFVCGPLVRYVPNAALAGMLIVLGFGMFQWRNIRVALKATRSDAAVLILTFAVAVLVNLRVAIYVGVLSSLALFLRKASAPHLVEYDFDGETMREISGPSERSHPEISIIHVEGELFFGAAELFQDEVRRVAEDKNIQVVILRMKNARNLDATAVMALEELLKFLVSSGRLLLISGASAEVIGVLRRSGLLDLMGEECVFESEDNLTAATRKALVRAQQFLGKAVTPEVRVFYDKSHVEQQPPPSQRDKPEV
jgi:SulP family sulfate permease